MRATNRNTNQVNLTQTNLYLDSKINHNIQWWHSRYKWIFVTFVCRIFWIVLLLACLAVLVYQIVDRVTHFYSYPVTVNVKVNYNTTLDFPAVTICNQNAFK